MFDILGEGVGVKLIRNKKIVKTFYIKWDQKDLENDVKKFRGPLEKPHLKEFDPDLARSLYDKLLLPALKDVPKGTPIIIIPDGILAALPFEALVTGGKTTWSKVEMDWPERFKYYPDGLTYLGDQHPISYYQSITALTLVRSRTSKNKPSEKILVIADPVYDSRDPRTQRAGKNYFQLVATIEQDPVGHFKLERASETGVLADNLQKMYGSNCLALTGLKANKADFLSKIAPKIDQFGSVVFATHGVGNKVYGVMEPFLALTMVPPGTDGFLKMSDILSLKMNADIVVTTDQSGLGKYLSGEGLMSMGRAFQYAGSKSVLVALWPPVEKSAVSLTENFFKHRKEGKTKLEALQAARNDIRNAGYKHPFFWAAFVLVGEAS